MLTERRVLVKNLHSTLNFDKSLLHRTSSLRLKIPPCSHHYYSPQLKYGKTGQQRPSAIPDNPQPAGWGAEPELRLEAQKACHSLLTHPPPNQGVFTAFQVFFQVDLIFQSSFRFYGKNAKVVPRVPIYPTPNFSYD